MLVHVVYTTNFIRNALTKDSWIFQYVHSFGNTQTHGERQNAILEQQKYTICHIKTIKGIYTPAHSVKWFSFFLFKVFHCLLIYYCLHYLLRRRQRRFDMDVIWQWHAMSHTFIAVGFKFFVFVLVLSFLFASSRINCHQLHNISCVAPVSFCCAR